MFISWCTSTVSGAGIALPVVSLPPGIFSGYFPGPVHCSCALCNGAAPYHGQPLPFLSYSNNTLLLFALPFSFLMMVMGNNLAAETNKKEENEPQSYTKKKFYTFYFSHEGTRRYTKEIYGD